VAWSPSYSLMKAAASVANCERLSFDAA